MNEFITSIKKRDPAAKSTISVIFTYPGVKAIFFHRISNFFYLAGFDFFGLAEMHGCMLRVTVAWPFPLGRALSAADWGSAYLAWLCSRCCFGS